MLPVSARELHFSSGHTNSLRRFVQPSDPRHKRDWHKAVCWGVDKIHCFVCIMAVFHIPATNNNQCPRWYSWHGFLCVEDGGDDDDDNDNDAELSSFSHP